MTPDTEQRNPDDGARGIIALFGASGTIGRAVAREALAAGYHLIWIARREPDGALAHDPRVTVRRVDFSQGSDQLIADLKIALAGRSGEQAPSARPRAVISCVASRTGTPQDAWSVDHDLQCAILRATQAVGIDRFILLSAICVQKPELDFQYAKRQFEETLQASDLIWSIVRPTAYFKSLTGQIDRVVDGKPFMLFGDGTLTACKPISDRDLAVYILSCLDEPARQNAILPIGGPGPALTLRDIGEMVFSLSGKPPRFKSVPPGLLNHIARALSVVGTIMPPLREKAALARIGHYYATQSMLVWNDGAGRYDADATPSFGEDRLEDYIKARLGGTVSDDRADHRVF